MAEDSITEVLLGTAVLVAAVGGVAAYILWTRDRSGISGWPKEAFLGMATFLTGIAILLWVVFHLVRSKEDFFSRPQSFFGLVLPISMIAIGWYWVRGDYKGIQDQDIDHDSSEIRDSVNEAKAQLPRFIDHVMRHTDATYIKFPIVTTMGNTEHVWAYVHKIENAKFYVSILKQPRMKLGKFENHREVPESEVQDWQILHPDGRISGAFTVIASFRYLERRGVRLNRTMRKQKSQLLDG